MSEIQLNTIEEAIEDFREGKFLIVVDDEDRENEGDFIIAAEKVTPEKINFMLKNGRGVLCAPITEERCQELELDMQVANNTSLLGTPFTITVDKLGGKCTTGVSMYDRAETILALADPKTKPSDLGRPGHINPLRARSRGVLRRAGHTEAAVDLARLAGLYPAGALIEIINEDGTMARLPQLIEVAKKFDIKIICIKDLIAYRLRTESIVENGVEVDLPTEYGHFRLIPFRQKSNGLEHIGLMEKMKAYKLQEDGLDTVDANLHLGHQADERDYGVGAQILRHIGVTKMRLMSNNPVKRVGLEAYGLEVVENVPIEVKPNPYNEFYMKTKKERMGHVLHNIK